MCTSSRVYLHDHDDVDDYVIKAKVELNVINKYYRKKMDNQEKTTKWVNIFVISECKKKKFRKKKWWHISGKQCAERLGKFQNGKILKEKQSFLQL